MTLDQSLLKKNRFPTMLLPNKFYAYKRYPNIEENNRSMRRFEPGFRCTGKHWLYDYENEFYHQ